MQVLRTEVQDLRNFELSPMVIYLHYFIFNTSLGNHKSKWDTDIPSIHKRSYLQWHHSSFLQSGSNVTGVTMLITPLNLLPSAANPTLVLRYIWPCREKTCLRGFRHSEFQTSLLSYGD